MGIEKIFIKHSLETIELNRLLDKMPTINNTKCVFQ